MLVLPTYMTIIKSYKDDHMMRYTSRDVIFGVLPETANKSVCDASRESRHVHVHP